MADQKRVTRKGTRAMMRPKPPRVCRTNPYKPRVMPPPQLRGEV